MRSVYGPKWFLNLHKLFLSIFDSTFYVKIRLFSNDFWKIVIKMKWITKYKQIKSISIIASFHIKKQHLDFVFLFSRSTYCTTIFLFSFFFCCFQFFLDLFLNLAEPVISGCFFSSSGSLFRWPIGGAHCWIDLAFSWDPPQVFQTDPLHPFVSLDCSRISLTVSVLSRFLSQALLHVLSPAMCLHQLDWGDSCWT